jgi:hypothetical protein
VYYAFVIRKNKRQLAKVFVALLLVGAVTWFVSFFLSPEYSRNRVHPNYPIEHLDQSVRYILTLLANSLFDVAQLVRRGYSRLVFYCAGLVILLLYLTAFILFHKRKMWEKTIVPLYLMVYFWGVVLALLVARMPELGIRSAAAPRYASILQLGFLGVIWIFILWFRELSGWRKKTAWFLLIVFTAIPYFYHLGKAERTAAYNRNVHIKFANYVLNGDLDHPLLCRDPANRGKAGLQTLKEHKLNVFSDPDYYRKLQPAKKVRRPNFKQIVKEVVVKAREWLLRLSAREG